MKRTYLSASISLALLLATPSFAQDTQEPEFNFRQTMQSVMGAARENKYDVAMEVILAALPKTKGMQRLQALHLSIDMLRINEDWTRIPSLVDEFQALYNEVDIPAGRDTWATHIMSEKAAAALKVGDDVMSRDASAKALMLYKGISDSWATNAEGAWVSKKTGQSCPVLWQGHIRYDAYDEENGDTSCKYWHSNLLGGVELRVYKTETKDSGVATANLVKSIKQDLSKGSSFKTVEVKEAIKAKIPSTNKIQGYMVDYATKGRPPENGILIFSPGKSQLISMAYSDAYEEWALKSIGNIKQDL